MIRKFFDSDAAYAIYLEREIEEREIGKKNLEEENERYIKTIWTIFKSFFVFRR